MCVHIPCGYSLQTIVKVIAAFEIVLASICIILSGIFGLTLLANPSYVLTMLNYTMDETGTWISYIESENNNNNYNNVTFTSLEEEIDIDIDIGNDNNNNSNNTTTLLAKNDNDFLRFVNSKGSFQVSVILMILIYFICGLSLAILLLTAAQERHLQKLTIWMIFQSLILCIRLTLFIVWLFWMTNSNLRIDVVLSCILIHFYSFTILSIVNSFRQDIASLYKRDARSHKRRKLQDEGSKQRFIRNYS